MVVGFLLKKFVFLFFFTNFKIINAKNVVSSTLLAIVVWSLLISFYDIQRFYCFKKVSEYILYLTNCISALWCTYIYTEYNILIINDLRVRLSACGIKRSCNFGRRE